MNERRLKAQVILACHPCAEQIIFDHVSSQYFGNQSEKEQYYIDLVRKIHFNKTFDADEFQCNNKIDIHELKSCKTFFNHENQEYLDELEALTLQDVTGFPDQEADLVCKKCKGVNGEINFKQDRSADEGMSVYLKCPCGANYKINS